MASKSQTALTDLSELEAAEGKPAPRKSNGRQQKGRSTRTTRSRKSTRAKNADVIPAFLSQNEADETPDTASAARKGDARKPKRLRDIAKAANDDPGPAGKKRQPDEINETTNGHGALGPNAGNDGGLDDPELIALLEQLSATIDNANQVLSETPPLLGPVTNLQESQPASAAPKPAAGDEKVAMPVGETRIPVPPYVEPSFRNDDLEPPQVQPQRVQVERPSKPANRTALIAAGLLLAAGTGGYLAYTQNPDLLDASQIKESVLSLSTDGRQPAADQQQSISVRLPASGGVEVPAPARKPEESSAPAEPSRQDTAAAATQFEPPADNDGVAITEMLGDGAAAQQTASAGPARGVAGEPIGLTIDPPSTQAGVEVSIMVQGVPDKASLSKGSEIGGGTWILEEKDLEALALVTDPAFAPRDVSLQVAFVKSDGKIPESRIITVVVEPVHPPVTPAANGSAAVDAGKAPPAPLAASMAARGPARGGTSVAKSPDARALAATVSPTPEPRPEPQLSAVSTMTPAEESQFLKRGKDLLGQGDVAGARLLLEHASRRGSSAAMMLLGKTYDPEHLAKLGVRGVQPDIAQANAWYERASRKADR